jgi:hypothetical protein
MIYVVCATQVFTGLCFLICLRWGLAYIADRDKLEQRGYEQDRASFEKLKQESDEAISTLINQFTKERELLLERIQHPPMTQGQAATVGAETGAAIVDEELEADEEYGKAIPEEDHEEPTRVLSPTGPVQAIGAEAQHGG